MKQILNRIILAVFILSITQLADAAQGTAAPSTIDELFVAMELTEPQEAEFKALQQHQKTAKAGFEELTGAALTEARNTFFAERRASLKKIFSEKQLVIWKEFWKQRQNTNVEHAGTVNPSPDMIGHKDFIHVERIKGTWFMVDANGKRFVPTGMNHISPKSRFAPYNREHWLGEFGEGIFTKPNQINWQGPAVKKWMEQITKDHKDYHFTTIAFHYPATMPAEYFEKLGMNYMAKLKLGVINDTHAKRYGGFPDVFDPKWRASADRQVREFCAKHKNNKHLLAYSFNDLPDYDTRGLEGARIARKKAQFIRHPWVDIILSKPGMTEGKKVWKTVLQKHYKNPSEAGKIYGVRLKSWDDVASISEWGIPKNKSAGELDRDAMSQKITEAWLQINTHLVRKYDPNHLIMGDKIGFHTAQPDWVLDLVSKYVDVIMIQHYDYYTPKHEKFLKEIYAATGKPILNGDHAYGVVRPKMTAVKGRSVKDLDEMGREYATYLKGIMNLPFMIGWLNCGYMETWDGATTDNTGKCQCGFFDPFGKPLTEAMMQVKKANINAIKWHENAGSLEQVYSER
jgi:hypothetical protein